MEEQPLQLRPAAGPSHRWAKTLVAFYAVSVVAAALVLWRGAPAPAPRESPRVLFGQPGRFMSMGAPNAVGWVSIHGPIYQSESGSIWDRGTERWSRRLRELADRGDVKAIVLDIDSPGGSVGAVQELYSAIERIRAEKKKPVIALVGDVAASGGYYLAVACDKVVVHPGSLVGSIGVIFNSLNVEQLFVKLGIRSIPIKSGRLKDIGSPTRPMTPEERALLQGIIDSTYVQFLRAVALGRSLPEDKVRPLADGRVFNGQQALALGLVDQVGDSQDAINLAAKLAGIPGAPRVIREGDSFERVLGLINSAAPGLFRSGPEAEVWKGVRSLTHSGLEYRWQGLAP